MNYNFTANQVDMLIEACNSAITNIDTRLSFVSLGHPPRPTDESLVMRRANWTAIKGELLLASL